MPDVKKPAVVVAVQKWTGDVKATTTRMRTDAAHLRDLGSQASSGVKNAASAIESGLASLFEGVAKEICIKLDAFEHTIKNAGRGK